MMTSADGGGVEEHANVEIETYGLDKLLHIINPHIHHIRAHN